MYQVEPLPAFPDTPKKLRSNPEWGAFDPERSLVVRWITGTRDWELSGWIFQHGDVLVPFDVRLRLADEGGALITAVTFESFGASIFATKTLGIPAYVFRSSEQREEWRLLAAEGVLVYEDHRLRDRNAKPQFSAAGRSWRIGDFGYPEERH